MLQTVSNAVVEHNGARLRVCCVCVVYIVLTTISWVLVSGCWRDRGVGVLRSLRHPAATCR